MSIASKLKDLVIKWGGQPTKDDDSIEELISLLTELDAPSGGSGGSMMVNVEYIPATSTNHEAYLRCDKTWNEIDSAMRSGKVVYVAFPNSEYSSENIYAVVKADPGDEYTSPSIILGSNYQLNASANHGNYPEEVIV